MLKNFLVIATRNFLRQRFYSFINVFGLSTGLASALLIFLWVTDEMNVDAKYKDSDRLYRIVSNLKMTNGDILTWDITPGPLGEAVFETVPEVELSVRTMSNGSMLFQHGDQAFLERGIYADTTFFKLFDFKILEGDPTNLDKSSVAISQKMAKSLFGNEDAIGKVIRVAQKYDMEVRTVFADIEGGTSMRFEYVMPMEIYRQERGEGWHWGNFDHPLFLKLHAGASPEAVIHKINEMSNKRLAALGEKSTIDYLILPLKDYYLNSHFENGVQAGGRIQYVRIFSVVAIFILMIACINFMNMATARAVQRAKEVGIRKVIGAQRVSLVSQFIGESMVTTLLSMFVAVVMVYMLLPLFNGLVSKHIVINFGDPILVTSFVAIVLIVGLASGAYPAFFLSGYKPASVLKGSVSTGFRGTTLRKSLVIFQFALTVIMIASAIVAQQQIEFIRNRNIGYDRKEIFTFYGRGSVLKQFHAFKTQAEKIPGVQMVSRADNSLVRVGNQNRSVGWPGRPDDDNSFFRTVVVDYQFLEAMGLKLKEGRFFDNTMADTASYVVSQKAVDVMGLENPIGTNITQWNHPGKIVGVVEDFHSRSMHEAIDPVVFMFSPESSWVGNVVVRYDAAKTSEVTSAMGTLVKQFAPDYPFAYTFLDDDFEKMYSTEKMTGSLALGFTIIAIIISGLGLLALAAYTAERKKKEISIRKTLGASVGSIVGLMSSEFARLSLIAALIGCPVAWYLMGKFLESYQYHMDLTVGIFIGTAVVVVMISLITVIFQVAKAAVANPVDALRNE